jgi:hypothetical protein
MSSRPENSAVEPRAGMQDTVNRISGGGLGSMKVFLGGSKL